MYVLQTNVWGERGSIEIDIMGKWQPGSWWESTEDHFIANTLHGPGESPS